MFDGSVVLAALAAEGIDQGVTAAFRIIIATTAFRMASIAARR
jgi:hypothetical protein